MKPLLYVLLAASLVANVALVISSRYSVSFITVPETAPVSGNPVRPALPGQTTPGAPKDQKAGGGATATIPMTWQSATTEQDLQHVVAGLRAAGYPASIIRAVINQLLTERFAARFPNAGQPFWKRNASTPEMMATQTALGNERRALFDSLLGPDARPSAMMDADSRERRYGPLSDDKIDAIAKIERDYNEISADSMAKRRGNAATMTDAMAMMQAQQLMEKEKLADLAGALTPDELVQYEMRNSTSARTLINNLRNVEITEAEYAQLYQAQKAFDTANPPGAMRDQAAYAQRMTSQLALNDQAKAVLGDVRFYSYLEGADPIYAQVAQSLGKFPGVTAATTYQVYQLQTQLQGQMMQTARNGPTTPDQMEAMRNTVATYNTKLEATVGPEVAEAYRNQGMGRIFTSFRGAPRPATAGSTLVPLGK